ncbi:unnamed protein product [Polarella glacialis]|uniref:Uncharacterized protein n=1 Tax=Polarella glacialis TaxID=89957 RepID=A0A813FG86_POLGL|nr:unnamed protein product [Polarella glacialis]
MPAVACTIPVERWQPPDLVAGLARPQKKVSGVPVRPIGFMDFSMKPWRTPVRRMFRSGLSAEVPNDDDATPAGAFALRKDEEKDRLIGDRRPDNWYEVQIGYPDLPYAPRLQRILLKKRHGLSLRSRNAKDYYYILRTLKARLAAQVFGPRIPLSWLDDLQNAELDEIEPRERWDSSRLKCAGPSSSCPKVKRISVAMTGIMMGDTNAVKAGQALHRSMLRAYHVLQEGTELLPSMPFPQSDLISNVLIGHWALIAQVLLCDIKLRTGADWSRADRFDGLYNAEGFPMSEKKAQRGVVTGDLWGAWLQGIKGTLGVHSGSRYAPHLSER